MGARPLALLLAFFACFLCFAVVDFFFRVHPSQCACPDAVELVGGRLQKKQEVSILRANDAIEDVRQEQFKATIADVRWLKGELHRLQIEEVPRTEEAWHQLRKGINPRTREQQLADLRRYKGISHQEGGENRTGLLCPGELLVEQHHSNYGEPWAGGRDVFEFLAGAIRLKPQQRVLEIGCGTLRVGLHFIRHLLPFHYYCLERDPLSLMASLMYELPAQGLLRKRPIIVRSEEFDMEKLDLGIPFDLMFASAALLHIPDKLVWKGLAKLGPNLAPGHGRLFVSHNIKFCTRLPDNVCKTRLAQVGLEYVGMHTHDSLLFNHYEMWHQFKRSDAV